MNDIQYIFFNKKPSALYTLIQAFMNAKSDFADMERLPELHVEAKGLGIDRRHISDFNEVCGIPETSDMHILYPLTLSYPYMMRILCRKEMPFSMFKILNTRTGITMHRSISPDERLDIDCQNSRPRIVPRGMEMDIISRVRAGDETVWEGRTTYFVRAKFSDLNGAYIPPRLDVIADPMVADEWYLRAKDRIRFARISGDTNGIHYGAFYARWFGFERDFAQPIRIVARCVSSLSAANHGRPLRVEFFLKGPVYYERELVLIRQDMANGLRFNLYLKGSDRPCIEGILHVI